MALQVSSFTIHSQSNSGFVELEVKLKRTRRVNGKIKVQYSIWSAGGLVFQQIGLGSKTIAEL